MQAPCRRNDDTVSVLREENRFPYVIAVPHALWPHAANGSPPPSRGGRKSGGVPPYQRSGGGVGAEPGRRWVSGSAGSCYRDRGTAAMNRFFGKAKPKAPPPSLTDCIGTASALPGGGGGGGGLRERWNGPGSARPGRWGEARELRASLEGRRPAGPARLRWCGASAPSSVPVSGPAPPRRHGEGEGGGGGRTYGGLETEACGRIDRWTDGQTDGCGCRYAPAHGCASGYPGVERERCAGLLVCVLERV